MYDRKRLPAWTDRILYKANTANYENYSLEALQVNAAKMFINVIAKI